MPSKRISRAPGLKLMVPTSLPLGENINIGNFETPEIVPMKKAEFV
jgi:hypothetical protein